MKLLLSAVTLASGLLLAACASQPTGTASSASATPTPSASASATATPAATTAGSPVVLAQAAGSNGTILVAASNSMTVYTFDSDSPGVSKCNAGCINIWPAVTVPAGQTPTGGTGVTGQLGTIMRSDGSTQVTYNGLPLYFFHNDSKPGDTKGSYTGWSLVKP